MSKKQGRNVKRAVRCGLSVLCCAAMVCGLPVSAGINPQISDRQPVQKNGQFEGQVEWIRKTLREGDAQRVYQGETLSNVNFPLAGMGTGIVYFNGNLVPYAWDVGQLESESLMSENSLFAVFTEMEGETDSRILRNNIPLNNRNAFKDMPANSTVKGGQSKQGTYFINSSLVAPGYTSYNDSLKGEMRSGSFRLPAEATALAALVGGGNDDTIEYLGLADAQTGEVLVKLTGDRNEVMTQKSTPIPAAAYDRDLVVTITDMGSTGWGHINVDDIRFENEAGERVPVDGFVNGDFENQMEGWHIVGHESNPYGLPLCTADEVRAVMEYPFGYYDFDTALPVDVQLQMFSPMVPLNERDSVIPAGVFQIVLTNTSSKEVTASVLSTLANGLEGERSNRVVTDASGTYILLENDREDVSLGNGSLALWSPSGDAGYTAGGQTVRALFDQMEADGELDGKQTAAGTDAVAGLSESVRLQPGETKVVRFAYTWYFPHFFADNLWGKDHTDIGRRYAAFYENVEDVVADLAARYEELHSNTKAYHDSLYDTSLPYYLVDAAASTMDVLRSPTFYIAKDGTPYGWEGSDGRLGEGNCEGNCQHVWSYAEGFFDLYPEIAARWKKQDFTAQQQPGGLLYNRLGNIPADTTGTFPAMDGMFASVMLAYRLNQNMPDTAWIASIWPNIEKMMEACIRNYDPNQDGVCEKASVRMTYDRAMDGTTVRIGAMYLGALKAAERIACLLGDTQAAERYAGIYDKGAPALDAATWNGEYYEQIGGGTGVSDARTTNEGILTDTLLGQTHMYLYGLGDSLDTSHMRSQTNAAFKYNFFYPVGSRYRAQGNNLDRVYAKADDPATLVCTWPKGGSGTLMYQGEAWSGAEYSNAINLLYAGNIDKALATVWAVRSRYDGKDFDPLNERELGSYYARSMMAYGLLEAASGIEKDRQAGLLGFQPNIDSEDFRGFYASGDSFGTATQKRTVDGTSFRQTNTVEVRYGKLGLKTFRMYLPEELAESADGLELKVAVDGRAVGASWKREGSCVSVSFEEGTEVETGSVVSCAVTAQISRIFTFDETFAYGDQTAWDTISGLAVINDTGLVTSKEDGRTLLARRYLQLHEQKTTLEAELAENASAGWIWGAAEDGTGGYALTLDGSGAVTLEKDGRTVGPAAAALTEGSQTLVILVEEGTITVSLNGRKVLSAADTMTKAGTAALVMEGDAKVGGVRVQRPGDEDVPGGSGSGGSSDIENPNTSARLPLYVTLVLAAAGSAGVIGLAAYKAMRRKRRG